MEGKTQETAAAMAGMCVRSARKWQDGPLPSETKQERWWRTRPDPFDGVWEEEIEPLLRGDPTGKLKGTTIIEWLEEQHPGRFSASQLRTLQRRLQDWRALNGPDREVYFPQEHPPGREAQFDFTHGNSLEVTVAGQPYHHLLFQLILSHSGWRYAEVAAGETFLALKQGMQNALWTLGGIPEVVRSDNTSAATHELKGSRGRALNDNYAAPHCLKKDATERSASRNGCWANHCGYQSPSSEVELLMWAVLPPPFAASSCAGTGSLKGSLAMRSEAVLSSCSLLAYVGRAGQTITGCGPRAGVRRVRGGPALEHYRKPRRRLPLERSAWLLRGV